jgi:uncharacterized protein (TIRG00374 family)
MRRFGASLLGVVISIAAILIVLQSVDVRETAQALADTDLARLLPAVGLVAAGVAVRSWRWQRLLIPIASRAIPVIRITPVLLVGYLANATLPARLGEPIRAYLVARRETLKGFEVFGTVLLERVLDLAVLAVMAYLAALAIDAPTWVTQVTGVAAAFGAVVLALLMLVGLGPLIRFLDRVAPRIHQVYAKAVATRIAELAHGLGGRSRRTPTVEAGALTVVIWLIDTSICWLVVQSLGFEITPAAALLVVGVAALGTAIPSAPGYIGTYELAASAAAAAVGLDPPVALSLAILLHAVTFLPVVLAGAAVLVGLGVGSLSELARKAAESQQESPPANS